MQECQPKRGKGARSHARRGKAVRMVHNKRGTERRSAKNSETAGKCEKSEKHTESTISSGRDTWHIISKYGLSSVLHFALDQSESLGSQHVGLDCVLGV